MQSGLEAQHPMGPPITLGALSPPLVRKILADHFLVAGVPLLEAVTLVSVCCCWRDSVANSAEWIRLYAGSASVLQGIVSRRVRDELCRRRLQPGETKRFLTLWGDCTLAGGVVLPTTPVEDVGLHIQWARTEYQRAVEKFRAVDRVLIGAFALIDVKKALSTEEHWSVPVTAVISALLLAPQAILWLTMRADGIVDCPWSIGAGLGLVACGVWIPHISWRLWIALRFVRLQHSVRWLVLGLAQHSLSPPPLIMDWRLSLSSCWCARPLFWASCIASIIAFFVLLVAETDAPLLAATLLNCVPLLCVGALIFIFRSLHDHHDEEFLFQAAAIHGILGWVLLFQTLASESACASHSSNIYLDQGCRAKVCFACTSILLPLAACYGLTVRVIKLAIHNSRLRVGQGRLPEGVDVGVLCIGLVSLVFAHVFLAVLVGRSIRSPLAMKVPLVLFAAPVQILTLLSLPTMWEIYDDHRIDVARAFRSAFPVHACQRIACACKRRRPAAQGAIQAGGEP